jgi:hypothetical protein
MHLPPVGARTSGPEGRRIAAVPADHHTHAQQKDHRRRGNPAAIAVVGKRAAPFLRGHDVSRADGEGL